VYIIVLNGKSTNLLILHKYVGDSMLRETGRVWNKLSGWYIGNFIKKLPAVWNMQYFMLNIGTYMYKGCVQGCIEHVGKHKSSSMFVWKCFYGGLKTLRVHAKLLMKYFKDISNNCIFLEAESLW
jgi:hypothetical protein